MIEEADKLDFVKNFKKCASKDPTDRVKGRAAELEKILTNHKFDKKLILRIYRELLKFTNK